MLAGPFVAEMLLVRRKKKRNQCLFLLEKIALCTLLVFSYYYRVVLLSVKACNYGLSLFFLAVTTIPHECIAHNFSISAFQCK